MESQLAAALPKSFLHLVASKSNSQQISDATVIKSLVLNESVFRAFPESAKGHLMTHLWSHKSLETDDHVTRCVYDILKRKLLSLIGRGSEEVLIDSPLWDGAVKKVSAQMMASPVDAAHLLRPLKNVHFLKKLAEQLFEEVRGCQTPEEVDLLLIQLFQGRCAVVPHLMRVWPSVLGPGCGEETKTLFFQWAAWYVQERYPGWEEEYAERFDHYKQLCDSFGVNLGDREIGRLFLSHRQVVELLKRPDLSRELSLSLLLWSLQHSTPADPSFLLQQLRERVHDLIMHAPQHLSDIETFIILCMEAVYPLSDVSPEQLKSIEAELHYFGARRSFACRIRDFIKKRQGKVESPCKAPQQPQTANLASYIPQDVFTHFDTYFRRRRLVPDGSVRALPDSILVKALSADLAFLRSVPDEMQGPLLKAIWEYKSSPDDMQDTVLAYENLKKELFPVIWDDPKAKPSRVRFWEELSGRPFSDFFGALGLSVDAKKCYCDLLAHVFDPAQTPKNYRKIIGTCSPEVVKELFEWFLQVVVEDSLEKSDEELDAQLLLYHSKCDSAEAFHGTVLHVLIDNVHLNRAEVAARVETSRSFWACYIYIKECRSILDHDWMTHFPGMMSTLLPHLRRWTGYGCDHGEMKNTLKVLRSRRERLTHDDETLKIRLTRESTDLNKKEQSWKELKGFLDQSESQNYVINRRFSDLDSRSFSDILNATDGFIKWNKAFRRVGPEGLRKAALLYVHDSLEGIEIQLLGNTRRRELAQIEFKKNWDRLLEHEHQIEKAMSAAHTEIRLFFFPVIDAIQKPLIYYAKIHFSRLAQNNFATLLSPQPLCRLMNAYLDLTWGILNESERGYLTHHDCILAGLSWALKQRDASAISYFLDLASKDPTDLFRRISQGFRGTGAAQLSPDSLEALKKKIYDDVLPKKDLSPYKKLELMMEEAASHIIFPHQLCHHVLEFVETGAAWEISLVIGKLLRSDSLVTDLVLEAWPSLKTKPKLSSDVLADIFKKVDDQLPTPENDGIERFHYFQRLCDDLDVLPTPVFLRRVMDQSFMVALLRDVTQKEMWVSCLLVALASFASLTKDELLTCFEPLQRLLPKLLTVEKDSEPLKKLLRRCLNEKYPFEADPEMIERHYAEIKAVSPLFKLCEPVYPVILNRSMTAKRATFVLMQEEDWSAENPLLTAALIFFGSNPEAVTKQVLTRVMSKAEFLPSDVESTPSACNAAADILSKSLVAVKGAKEYTENVMAVVIKKISPLHYSRELATRLNDGIVLRALQRGVEEKNVCFVNAAIRYLGAMSSQSFEAIKPLYIDQWLDKARSSQLPVHPDFLAGLGETMRLHHAALAKKNIEHNVKMGYPKFQIGKACDWHAGVKEHRAIFERAIRLTENWRRWSTKELGSRGENDFYHYFSETLSPLGALCLCEIAVNRNDLELLQIALRVITPLLKNGSAQSYALVVLKLLSNPSDILVASLQKDSSMMSTVLASCMSLCFSGNLDQRVKTTGEKFINLATLLKTFSMEQFETVMERCLTVEFARVFFESAESDRDGDFLRVTLDWFVQNPWKERDNYPRFYRLYEMFRFLGEARRDSWYEGAQHLRHLEPHPSHNFKETIETFWGSDTKVKVEYKGRLKLDDASFRALQRYLIDVFFGRAAHAVNGDISEPVAILKRIFGDPLPLR